MDGDLRAPHLWVAQGIGVPRAERQPAGDMIRGGQLEMGRHLVRQLVVGLSAMKQREQPSEEGPHFQCLE